MSTTSIDPASCLTGTATEWGSSRWRERRRCARAYDLRYNKLIQLRRSNDDSLDSEAPTRPSYYDLGTICHGVLEFAQRLVLAEEDPALWPLVIEAAHGSKRFDAEIIDRAETLMRHYFLHYGVENAGWPDGVKILAVEVPLLANINGQPITGRADTILQFPSGEIVVADHKTRAAKLPDDRAMYTRELSTDTQFCALSWLVASKYDLDYYPSVWLNALIKTQRPKFDRLIVPFGDDSIGRWYMWQSRWAEVDLGDDTPNPDACVQIIGSRRCTYFLHCHGTEEERTKYFTQGDQDEPETELK